MGTVFCIKLPSKKFLRRGGLRGLGGFSQKCSKQAVDASVGVGHPPTCLPWQKEECGPPTEGVTSLFEHRYKTCT